MEELKRNKLATGIIIVATIILAFIAIFSALRLYNLREESISPAAPESVPFADTTSSCQIVSFTISTPTPTPTGTITPSPTGTITPVPSSTPTSTPVPTGTNAPTATPTSPPVGGPSATITPTPSPTSPPGSTSTPTSVSTSAPTATPVDELPQAGTSYPTIMLVAAGFVIILFSLLLAL